MTTGTEPVAEKLSPEVKARWLEALRSGKYKQGREMLRPNRNCFCCLGVLADITDKDAWSKDGVFYWRAVENGFEDRSTELPSDFRKQVGLSLEQVRVLVSMNDGDGPSHMAPSTLVVEPKSFAEIADYIEANL